MAIVSKSAIILWRVIKLAIIETTVETGRVRGIRGNNQAFSLFLGIPYAAPPIGELRWRAPQPAPAWEGTLLAGEYREIPMQNRFPKGSFFQRESYPIELPMSEDCLYINVTTPAESSGERLPVALWIYGGAYRRGFANKLETDGEAFAKRGVVFVSFNYRLGAFGYFAHPDLRKEAVRHVSGNYGLQDQIFALEWVCRNIAAFGGDPERITVFGQSAGAMSAQMLTSTPITRGKIQRAIFESGGGLGGMTGPGQASSEPMEDMERRGEKFLSRLGVNSIEEARLLPAERILEGYTAFEQEIGIGIIPFCPAVDGYYLSKPLYQTVLDGDEHDIDYLLGCCSNESSTWMEKPDRKDPEEAVAMLRGRYGAEAEPIIRELAADTPEGAEQYLLGQMTLKMYQGVLNWCDYRAKTGKKASYLYMFTRDVPDHPFGGTYHSGEHMYIFRTIARSWRNYTGADYELSGQVCDYWTNFIKTGNPNGNGLSVWQPYTCDGENCMALDQKCHMMAFPRNILLDAEQALLFQLSEGY